MNKITVADRLGNTKTLKVGFSWKHLFLGPIYSFARGFILTGIFELLYIFYFLPIPGMDFFVSLVSKIPLNEEWIVRITKFLMYFRGSVYHLILGICIVVFLHLLISFKEGPKSIRKYMKRRDLLPVDEKDARILIKYHAFDENVKMAEDFDVRKSNSYRSAEENWYETNHERLRESSQNSRLNTSSLTRQDIYKTRIDQVEKSYKLGLISKSEYERKIRGIKDGK
jgi:hypothetical protein